MTGLPAIRSRIVQAAESQEGETDPRPYWLSALGPVPGPFPKHWCGAFGLWCLHQAGAALKVRWVIGVGFLLKACRARPSRERTLPGDIAYRNAPYQHHAVVVAVDGETVVTVDGNSTGGAVVRHHSPLSSWTAFFDTSPTFPKEAP